jgi:hypothetical protein
MRILYIQCKRNSSCGSRRSEIISFVHRAKYGIQPYDHNDDQWDHNLLGNIIQQWNTNRDTHCCVALFNDNDIDYCFVILILFVTLKNNWRIRQLTNWYHALNNKTYVINHYGRCLRVSDTPMINH